MKYFLFIFLLLFSGFAEARGKGGAYSQSVLVSSKIGVAISGLESATPGVPCPSTTGVDVECQAYASNGYAYWRLTFAWEQLQPTLGGSFNSTYQGYITNVIRQGGLLGVKVILDCHNFGRYNGVAIGAASGPTYAQFANLWSRLATVVQGTAGLGGYELMNEPYSMPSYQTVPLMYQAAVTAIRAVDTATAIYMDGDAYASAYGWNGNCSNCGGAPVGGWGAGGNAQLLTVTDPNNNLVFVAHAYADYDGSGTYPVYPASVAVVAGCTAANDTYACAQLMGDQLTSPTSTLDTNILVKRMTPFVTFCTSNNVSCAVTETGVPPDDQNWLTALNLQLAYLQTNNVLFTYWAAGVYSACANYPSSCGYPLGIEPTNGENTVQVAVLTKYSGAAQPTNYYLSGPQRGTSGVASSNFTVTYRGYVSSAFSVIPSDGGAGGTFTPSVVVCGGPAFNCAANFTYTALGSSVYAISTTNTKGLTDPSAIGYATVADEFSSNGISGSQIWSDCWPIKNYAPYIGPAYTLRRSSDNALRTFNFTSYALGATIDQTAVSTWLNGATAYVATCYDQGPNGNNWTLAYDPSHSITPSVSAQAQLVLNDKNGLPAMRLANTQMSVPTPISGTTAMTTILAYEPTGYQSHEGTGPINWNFNCCNLSSASAYASDAFANAGGGTARSYTQDNVWGVVGGAYTGGVTDGSFVNNNGTLVGRNTANTSPFSSYTTYAQIGWLFFSASTTSADLSGGIFLGSGLSQTSLASIVGTEQTNLGIGTTFPSYTFKSATLNRNTSGANTQPWEGVNESGMEFGGGQPLYPTQASANFWYGMGSNIGRDPISWEYIQPTLGSALSSTVVSGLTTFVVAQNALGLDTIIDIHNYCQYNGKAIGASGGPTQANFVDLWTRIASIPGIQGNSKVQFDLMNEPGACSETTMAAAAQAAINAIRATETVTHYIHYEDPSYQCYNVASLAGPTFKTLTDSANKLILQCHEYFDSNNSGGSDYAANNAWQNLQSATTYAKANGIALFLGEFGMGFTPSMYAQDKAALEYIAANLNSGSGGWVGWTAWGAGPYWSETYQLLIEPRDFNSPQIYRPMDNLFNTEITGNVWPATQTFTNCYSSPTASCTVQFP